MDVRWIAGVQVPLLRALAAAARTCSGMPGQRAAVEAGAEQLADVVGQLQGSSDAAVRRAAAEAAQALGL
jgi:hypothetical protein